MATAVVRMEIDFSPKSKLPCSLCGQPFLKHFQPPADADWTRAANWCPAGDGFCSRSYRIKKGEVE
jgi:hypothetical protein